MAAYGLYTHIASNKTRSIALLIGLFLLIYVIVFAGAIFLEIIVVIALKASNRLAHTDHVNATFGSPGWIGRLFLTDHLLAFEITSIVLLVAAVGGVILGSHTKRSQLEESAQ